ncbi:phosphotransferase [soil metagenome]
MKPDALQAVAEYLATARWFGGKGRDLTVTGSVRVGSLGADDGVTWPAVHVELVTVEYAPSTGSGQAAVSGEIETYQVPLALYDGAQERLEHALVGTWKDDVLGTVVAYDAVHDREAAALYLRAFDEAAGGTTALGDLRFHRLPGHDLDLGTHSTLFSGEQSNSSMAFGEDALMKLFRKVNTGRNPDIVIHGALTQRESDHVAALFGWLELTPEGADEPVQLAMLQQFLRTASDGWDLALASVRDLFAEADLHADEVGGDFAGEAERLGPATAQVHDVLAEEFPTHMWAAEDLTALSEAMLTRFEVALAIVPQLADHADALRATFADVASLGASGQSATAQRLHGDFHLGQTLRTVKGWKIVDFEGEPAKPLSERVRPDLVWRDVAGMLRSFDYAAHAVEADVQADDEERRQIAFRATEWADRNTSAFLRGYVDNSGRTSDGTLSPDQDLILRAYIADKAVYEAVYEARNRPTWLPIPLGAIARITHPQEAPPS